MALRPAEGTRQAEDKAGDGPGLPTAPCGSATPEGLVANGGRVLAVTALGADLAEARARAYAGVGAIDWPEGFWRNDIGWRALG